MILILGPRQGQPLGLITKERVERVQVIVEEEIPQLYSTALAVANISSLVVG